MEELPISKNLAITLRKIDSKITTQNDHLRLFGMKVVLTCGPTQKVNHLLSGTNSMAELDACPMLQRGTCTSAPVMYKALPHTCTAPLAHMHYNLYSTSTAIKGLPSCQATNR